MKQHPVLPLLIAVLAVVVLAGACGGSSEGDATVVASINGRELTRGQLDDLLPDGDNTVASRVAGTVSTWLVAQAVEFELADRGYEPTEKEREDSRAVVEAREIARNDFEEDLLSAAYALSLTAGRWSDDEAANLGDPDPPNYLCANHILFEFTEDAEVGLERYNGGEDFAELAMELSTGPSGPNGGDLGCAIEGSYVVNFEEAAYAADAGEVIGPVETEFGFHLIEIESVGPATIENHPSADEAALEAILDQARQGQVAGLVIVLEASAIANFGGSAEVAPTIGTLDRETLEISVG